MTPSPSRHRDPDGPRGRHGFVHKNLTIEEQAREVTRVKKAQSGIVVDSGDDSHPSRTLEEALAISGSTDQRAARDRRGQAPVGILTNRDVRFEKRLSLQVAS